MSFRGGRPLGLGWHIVLPVLGGTLVAVGLGMGVCWVAAIAYGDGAGAALGLPALGCTAAGGLGLLLARRLKATPLRPRDVFFSVAMAWILAAAVSGLPYLIEGTLDRPVDAFFEAMSGFTTTGATVIADVEVVPRGLLLWRSLTQWMGGLGIVVLFVAVAPAAGLAAARVFHAETTGPTAERLTPRIADTAKILWFIYAGLTLAGFAALVAAGMGPFDAVNHIFTAMATGGFSTRNASIGAFNSLAIELVVIVFMVAAGTNFALYWRVLRRRSPWPQLAEVRAYLGILAAASAVMAVGLLVSDDAAGLPDALRQGSFQVVSLMTTTGFTTADFDLWSDFARMALLMLMFVGGCAGSTAGGLKVVRVQLLGQSAGQEVRRQLKPSAVTVLRLRGRVFSEDVRRGVLGFFLLYMGVFGIATLAMTVVGLDIVSAAGAVAATLNDVGPGIGIVGADETENYVAVPQGGLWILAACMLIGRLEVFTVLALVTRAFWRS